MKQYLNIKTKKAVIFLIAAILIFAFSVAVNRIRNGLILSVLIVFLGALDFKNLQLSKKNKQIALCVILLVSSLVISSLSQRSCNETLFQLPIVNILSELMIVLILLVITTLIFKSEKTAITAVAIPIILLLTVDYYVFCFRGNELTPSDLLAINTAMKVMPNYQFDLFSFHLYVYSFLCMFLTLVWSTPKLVEKKLGVRSYAVGLASVCVFVFLISVCYRYIVPNHFAINGTLKNGYLVNFVSQLKESIIFKPSGYSSKTIDGIYQKYEGTDTKNTDQDRPDIIVVMNESFADMNHIGDLPVNTAVTPYLDSVSDYVYKGYTLSSVYGGGTPNSEYEFLTGNSMMFFPQGMIAYHQIIKGPTYSIVTDLNKLGYECIAMHPFHSSGWMRNKIYPYLGFDETYFLEDFPEEKLIRHYRSDQYMYEVLLDKYHKACESNDNVFVFGVTMQNHGAFDYEEDDFQNTIELQFESGNQYPEAEQYLSLIHESDSALQYLLEELKKEERKVVVLFYGDHFPKLDDEFYKELHGSDFKTLDEIQLKYTVPFLIWTNYYSQNEEVPMTSMNYLSTYLLDASGIELPVYNRFIKDVNGVSSAMNTNGIYLNDKKQFTKFSSSVLDEYELIKEYNYMVYDSSKGNKDTRFFPIPDSGE
ncbi:MAG: LTA synthase family protein [Solobacterium sp.]|nr:LTA synthase family protein [Solobacterium sp.]